MTDKKQLASVTEVTSVASGQTIVLAGASGGTQRISLDNLRKAILSGASLEAMEDNVFIMYHRKSDNFPLMAKPQYWTSIQASGEVAEGVVVVEGGHVLVVAPTEPSAGTLNWSSAQVSGGGKTTTDRLTTIDDWTGKASTAAQVAHAECSGADYAPGFCNTYSRVNANGKGLTAGRWWLPSVGEMLMIYANMQKINRALSLINGATQLQRTAYWTSTEASAASAWGLYLSAGSLTYWNNKVPSKLRVRPVSAFLQ